MFYLTLSIMEFIEQCRFVDEPTTEGLLAATDFSGVEKSRIQALVNFYEVRA